MELRVPVGSTEHQIGHDSPIRPRFEVAFAGEHLMAWPVERGELDDLRAAIRAVLARGDMGPAATWWRGHETRYRAARRACAWHVPRSTAAHVYALAFRMWNATRVEHRRYLALPPEEVSATLELGARSRDGALVVNAERWFRVEHAMEQCERIVRDAGPVGSAANVANETMASVVLRTLIATLWDLEQPLDEESTFAGPDADLRWLAELTFHDEDTGADRQAEQLSNPYRDRARLSTHSDAFWTPYDVVQFVNGQVGFGWLLDAAIGAFRPSGGPGPWLKMPTNAIPFVDSAWPTLPLFRARVPGEDRTFAKELAPDWFVLDPQDDAQLVQSEGDERGNSGHDAAPLVDRFCRLIDDARKGDQVLVLRCEYFSLTDDRARDVSWGRPGPEAER